MPFPAPQALERSGTHSDLELERDTANVHEAVKALLRVYQFRDRDRICCHDVSVTQCHALEHLVEEGPVSQKEIAAALYLDKSTTSRVVAALERKGYASRTPDPEDRRAHRVAATQDGRELVATIEADMLARESRLLADFDSEVRQAMATLIRKLARARASSLNPESGSCSGTG